MVSAPKEGLVCKIDLSDNSVEVKKISDRSSPTTDHDEDAIKLGADEIFMESEFGYLFYRKVVDYVEIARNTRVIVYQRINSRSQPDYIREFFS